MGFSSDSRLLASGTYEGIVCVWDLATGSLYQTIDGHSEWVDSLAFSPDNRLLATCSADYTLCLWNLATGVLDDFAMSFSLPMNLYISIEDIGWIKINRERILWLPVESRPRLFKINGNTLALGHALG
ncbi:hypothetical protein N7489_008006 [Penicillium chrysogenum]|uniref:Mitochondrial division protein 1 n=1 Tax=Penicillium chrysogenum TaxID=5076 RepID=A0ABQ8WB82_PENCH|nr:uncharacterized protein N7489_008006 [Penicillium chrysogenum]KAJ5237915.1 hypothetical protein N7489_008006 [Penicillium chrysogenum]KAJ5261824.1 hypothetical protein N7505_008691 [Penicillium chrysogenum]KAJ6159752.1 hypothetical protein N7497_004289 [Penicillium chrysogenum]